ncbi:MAG: AI-2E family transporter, partial [Mariprofundaceae bacterium]
MNQLREWLRLRMADTELVMLLVSLLAIFSILILFGPMLAPLLLAIALAYVLDGIVDLLGRCRIPRLLAI